MKIELDIKYNGVDVNSSSKHHQLKEELLTDWSVYECILFHLVSNAVKHGTKQLIGIKLVIKSAP
jgi:hypothetical protein